MNPNKKQEKAILFDAMKEAGIVKENVESGVALTGKIKGVEAISYGDIRKIKGEIKSNLADWTNRDFALYIKNKYEEKYSADWGLNVVGVVTYIGRIKQSILDNLGFCDNIVFKII
jgi:hypothetical protein